MYIYIFMHTKTHTYLAFVPHYMVLEAFPVMVCRGCFWGCLGYWESNMWYWESNQYFPIQSMWANATCHLPVPVKINLSWTFCKAFIPLFFFIAFPTTSILWPKTRYLHHIFEKHPMCVIVLSRLDILFGNFFTHCSLFFFLSFWINFFLCKHIS